MLRVVVLCWMVAAAAFVCAAADPVAEGFPAWEGLEDENRICGRTLKTDEGHTPRKARFTGLSAISTL